jgi:hypothetical protein
MAFFHRRLIRLVVLPMALAVGLDAGAGVETGEDADTSRRSWTWSDQGVSVQLLQLLPDQTRAFFLGRGFKAQDAERIATSCVFQTIFRNDGDRPVAYDLNDWTRRHDGERAPLRTRERWDTSWEAGTLGQPQRIALRWALLPTVQRFEPGDYNWGMTSFGLPPGATFDLTISVRLGGETVTAEVPAVTCAADR